MMFYMAGTNVLRYILQKQGAQGWSPRNLSALVLVQEQFSHCQRLNPQEKLKCSEALIQQ